MIAQGCIGHCNMVSGRRLIVSYRTCCRRVLCGKRHHVSPQGACHVQLMARRPVLMFACIMHCYKVISQGENYFLLLPHNLLCLQSQSGESM